MTAGSHGRAKGLALALLAATQFVIVLDASIVNVALPSIGRALDFSQDDLSWVVNAYTLTFGGFLLLGGRLADLLGRRRVFIAGLVLFSIASLAGGLAQSDVWLIAARGDPGPRRGDHLPRRALARHDDVRRGRRAQPRAGRLGRGRRLRRRGRRAARRRADPVRRAGSGCCSSTCRSASRAAFLAPRLLPESRDTESDRVFDVAGATTVTAGLALLVYTLVDANNAGWTSTQTLGLGAISLVLLAAFVAIESRTSNPLMPFSIFRLRTLARRGRRRPADRHVAVRDVLLPVALHAAGARLRRAEDGRRLPPARAEHHRQRRRRLAARDARGLQADADRRACC